MLGQPDKELFDDINLSPRTEEEQIIHANIAAAWSALGKGAPLGIKCYTAVDEVARRNPKFRGDQSLMDPRWVGEGTVTAIVTVTGTEIPRIPGYQESRELQTRLAAAAPGVCVVIEPRDSQASDGHRLAQ